MKYLLEQKLCWRILTSKVYGILERRHHFNHLYSNPEGPALHVIRSLGHAGILQYRLCLPLAFVTGKSLIKTRRKFAIRQGIWTALQLVQLLCSAGTLSTPPGNTKCRCRMPRMAPSLGGALLLSGQCRRKTS